MKVAWAVVWTVTWAAWASTAPTKNSEGDMIAAFSSSFLINQRPARRVQRDTDDTSEESSSKVVEAKVISIPEPSTSIYYKRQITDSNSGATGSLASASGVPLSVTAAAPSSANPASNVARVGVGLDINPVDHATQSVQTSAYGVSLPSSNPSLAPPDFFVKELEALEDLIQAGHFSGGVPLDSYQADVGGIGGQQAVSGSIQGSVAIPLQVTEIGGLQGDFITGDPQLFSSDLLNINSGNLQGLQGASLGSGGGLHGNFGNLNFPGIDLGTGGLEGKQLDPGTFVTTDLLGNTGELTGASGGFGESYLGSGGLDGLQLNAGGLDGLQSDSFGISLPFGNTGGLQDGSGGFDSLQGGSYGVSLPLGNTGGLQGGAGGFDGLQGDSYGVSLPLGNSGGLQSSTYGVSLPLGNSGGLQGGSGGFDGLQGDSYGVSLPLGNSGGLQSSTYGVSLPLGSNDGVAGGSGGLEGLQGGSYGVSLPLGNTGDLQLGSVGLGDLQVNLGNLHVDPAGFAATQLDAGGTGGVALQAAGLGGAGASAGVTGTAGPGVNTGVLLGDSGVSDVTSGDLGNVGVSLAEAVEVNQFSADPTAVPGTFTASSFDSASLDSLGELLSDNVEDITDPTQSLGSFLMDINGKDGMMVLPASSLDDLQTGDLSIAAATNVSLYTNFDVSEEAKDDGFIDIDIDLTTQDTDNLEITPSLATILATSTGGGNNGADSVDSLFLSVADENASSSSSSTTPSTTTTTGTTTTTTTTPGPPRLASILPNLLFAKGQFLGTLLGGLQDIGVTIYKAITETDWRSPHPRHSYS